MIKTIVKYITKEIKAAEEYIHEAYMKKAHCKETADLFITLADEELSHAGMLLKQGQSLIDKINVDKESQMYEHDLKNITIWEWEKEQTHSCIAELKININSYKSM